MNELFIYITLAAIILLYIFAAVIYKKIKIIKLLILLLILAVYGVIKYFPDLITFINISDALLYYTYLIFMILIVYAITFKSKIKITQNLTDYDFFELEKELEELKNVSDLLRLRFINTIDLLNEGLIFYGENLEDLFITEAGKNIIQANSNQMTINEFEFRIYEEDKKQYLQTIKKVSKKLPHFEIKYRITRDSSYTWVVEKGKLFVHNGKSYIISTLKGIDIKLFPETSIQELDTLPNEQKLSQILIKLKKEKTTFYLIFIHLTNIPDINQRFGRDIGNLMIAEYIKKMKYHFAREHNSIFRVTGIEFALIIKEEQKYEVLKRALISGGDLINLRLNIGGIQQIVYPNVGIVRHDPWSNYDVNDFISLGHKSLDEAVRNNKKNFSIFGE